MDKATLVAGGLSAGAKLAALLRENRFSYAALFWFRKEDSERYDLVIGTRLVTDRGPIAAYSRIQQLFSKHELSPLEFSDISLVKAEDTRVVALRNLERRMIDSYGDIEREVRISTEGEQQTAIRLDFLLRDASVGNVFFPEAYVYDVKVSRGAEANAST